MPQTPGPARSIKRPLKRRKMNEPRSSIGWLWRSGDRTTRRQRHHAHERGGDFVLSGRARRFECFVGGRARQGGRGGARSRRSGIWSWLTTMRPRWRRRPRCPRCVRPICRRRPMTRPCSQKRNDPSSRPICQRGSAPTCRGCAAPVGIFAREPMVNGAGVRTRGLSRIDNSFRKTTRLPATQRSATGG